MSVTSWFRQTRVRLAIAYSGIFSIVALVAAVVLALAIARVEYGAIDDSLGSEASSIQSTLSSGGTLPGGNNAHDPLGQASGVGVGAYVFDSRARLLDSAGGHGPPPTALIPAVREAASAGAAVLETLTGDGVAHRMRAI